MLQLAGILTVLTILLTPVGWTLTAVWIFVAIVMGMVSASE